jgi:8-oxo-dGTP pyrophosphatase MutT (NUDIX family)
VSSERRAAGGEGQVPFPARHVLRRSLARRPEPTTGDAERSAAVLVCLYQDDILLVRRRTDPRDRWSGHIGLPGGRYEPQDRTLLATALRETHEELGFHAVQEGRVLGPLGTYLARHREPDDLAIGVFVAELERRPDLALSEEIDAAHWIELDALRSTDVEVPERPGLVPAYTPMSAEGELVVWGITYGILERLRRLD